MGALKALFKSRFILILFVMIAVMAVSSRSGMGPQIDHNPYARAKENRGPQMQGYSVYTNQEGTVLERFFGSIGNFFTPSPNREGVMVSSNLKQASYDLQGLRTEVQNSALKIKRLATAADASTRRAAARNPVNTQGIHRSHQSVIASANIQLNSLKKLATKLEEQQKPIAKCIMQVDGSYQYDEESQSQIAASCNLVLQDINKLIKSSRSELKELNTAVAMQRQGVQKILGRSSARPNKDQDPWMYRKQNGMASSRRAGPGRRNINSVPRTWR